MKKVGSGITVRTKPDMVPATPDTMRSFFEAHNARIREPWGGHGALIARVRTRLEEIKASAPSIHDDHDGWNAIFQERVTEGWYLRSIEIEARIAESAVEGGRPWEAVACAVRIGELVTELRMKQHWEHPALVGKAITDKRAEIRDESNARRHQQAEAEWWHWNAAAADIWKRHPHWKTSRVAMQVKKQLGLSRSVETIRKRLKKVGEAG